MTIAIALNTERQRQEFSVNALALRAGQSVGRVHSILQGVTPNPGILTVLDITRAMGKSLGWLEREMKRDR